MDISFIQHICDEGEIVTDQHTYDEYVGYYVDGKFIDKFGDLLGSGSNVKVLEDDQREYK